MRTTFYAFILLSAIATSCSSSADEHSEEKPQSTLSIEQEKEIDQLDSISSALDEATLEIEKSTEELDQILNDL